MKRIFSVILLTACLFALPVSAAPDVPLVYKDVRTSASFTLPEDWKKASLSPAYDFIDAKFVDAHDPSRIILYSSSDVFSYATESERGGRTRADCHVYALSPEDFEGMYDVSREDVTAITKGDNKYFVFPVTQEQKYYETTLNVTVICAVTMYNGHMYMFQYSGDPKSSAYLDFLSVLESAEFPNRIPPEDSMSKTSANIAEQPESTEHSPEISGMDDFQNILLLVAIGICVTFIGIKLSQYYDRQKFPKKKTNIRNVLTEKLKRHAAGIFWGIFFIAFFTVALWDYFSEFFSGKSVQEITGMILIYLGIGRVAGIITVIAESAFESKKEFGCLGELLILPIKLVGIIVSSLYVFLFIPDAVMNIWMAEKWSVSKSKYSHKPHNNNSPEP